MIYEVNIEEVNKTKNETSYKNNLGNIIFPKKKKSSGSIKICIHITIVSYTVNLLLFASEKSLRATRENCRLEYFSLRTSPCCIAVITTHIFIRLTRKK